MAVLDLAQNRIIIRIVYDGLPGSGKTTNLRQLCSFFTLLRRGELYTPEEVEGRTVFFDWLQVEGGVVAGYRLRCEMVTVPGQEEFAARRRHLLRAADGIVFVSDGTDAALARRRLQDLPAVPIVLQANKQDAQGAAPPKDIAAMLGADALPVVAARAAHGIGVRETAVMIIRAVAEAVQKYLIEHGPDALAGSAESPQDMFETMRKDQQPVREAVAAALAPASIADSLPPLPDDRAATGLVWPALRGREVVRHVTTMRAELREDLIGQNGTGEGSGKSDVFLYQAEGWCLKTSRRRRFDDLEDARGALVHLARNKLALGDLLLADTVATVKGDVQGGYWLWTVTPWLVTLRREMTDAAEARNVGALGRALEGYADSVVASLQLTERRGLSLDIHPSNFARSGDGIVYIDDDIDEHGRLPAIGHAVLRRIEEYRFYEPAIDRYVARLRQRFDDVFAPGSAMRELVREALAEASSHSAEAGAGRALLVDALAPRRAGSIR